MAVLRSSDNLRAFGLLEPLEEYNVDGARAFTEFAASFRRRAVQNLFCFVDGTAGLDEGEQRAEAAA
jgi:preprotein translocase subunit SecA